MCDKTYSIEKLATEATKGEITHLSGRLENLNESNANPVALVDNEALNKFDTTSTDTEIKTKEEDLVKPFILEGDVFKTYYTSTSEVNEEMRLLATKTNEGEEASRELTSKAIEAQRVAESILVHPAALRNRQRGENAKMTLVEVAQFDRKFLDLASEIGKAQTELENAETLRAQAVFDGEDSLVIFITGQIVDIKRHLATLQGDFDELCKVDGEELYLAIEHYATLQAENERLHADLVDCLQSEAKLKQDLVDANSELAVYKKSLGDEQMSHSAELLVERDKIFELEKKIKGLEKEIATRYGQVEKLTHDSDLLAEENKDLKMQNAKLNEQISNITNRSEQLVQKYKSLQKKNELLSRENEASKLSCDSYHSSYTEETE